MIQWEYLTIELVWGGEDSPLDDQLCNYGASGWEAIYFEFSAGWPPVGATGWVNVIFKRPIK